MTNHPASMTQHPHHAAIGMSFAVLAAVGFSAKAILVKLAWGVALVFASTLTYSIYLIWAGRAIARIGALRFTAYAMTVASVAVLIQFALTHPLADLHQSSRVYALSIAMAIFSTVLPVFLLSAGIRMIGSGHASMVGAIGPVSTIALAYVFLGEAISLAQIAGSLLVLAGVLVIGLKR